MNNLLSIFTILFIFGTFNASAQNFCGTKPYKSKSLIEFQNMEKPWVDMRSDDTIYVKTVLHIVGRNDGSGYISLQNVLEQACKTNRIYGKFGIHFYIADIRYINSSRYYDHNFSIGHEMMRKYKVNGAVNIFFVGNPAGNCGYYSGGPDCVALGNNCVTPNSTTWAHELGHYFSLPHTFLGWEGKDYNPNVATPLKVNGRYTETVDRNNCSYAADGFCDTPPDYLSYRWPCRGNSTSQVVQTDINGEEFRSDGSLIMSYSGDGCANRFSDEQIQAIRYNILTTRNIKGEKPDIPIINDTEISGIQPAMDATVYFDNVVFSWDAVEGAAGYVLEYTKLSEFNSHSTKVFLQDTFYIPDTIFPSWHTVYWHVKPYDYFSYCNNSFSERFSFNTQTTATSSPAVKNDIQVFPNPIEPYQTMQIRSEKGFAHDLKVIIYNTTGEIVQKKHFQGNLGNLISMNIRTLEPGLHFVRLLSSNGSSLHKLMILR